jgi:predicted Zn-ribbon and HTH transcriptional regulator
MEGWKMSKDERLTDEELDELIMHATRDRRQRLWAKRKNVYSVCRKCGHPFTEEEHGELQRCPECKERGAVKVNWNE